MAVVITLGLCVVLQDLKGKSVALLVTPVLLKGMGPPVFLPLVAALTSVAHTFALPGHFTHLQNPPYPQ